MKTVLARKNSLGEQLGLLLVQLIGLLLLVTGFLMGKELRENEKPIWMAFIFIGPGLFMIGACYARYGESLISKIIFCLFFGTGLISFIGIMLFFAFKA